MFLRIIKFDCTSEKSNCEEDNYIFLVSSQTPTDEQTEIDKDAQKNMKSNLMNQFV